MDRFRQLAARLALAFALLVHGLPMQVAVAAEPASAPCHSHGHDRQPPAGDCCDGCDLPCFANVPAAASVVTFVPNRLPPDAPPVAGFVAMAALATIPLQRPPIS